MALSISYYQDGEARTTSVLNRPLSQLATAVAALQTAAADGGESGRLVATGVPCTGVGVGSVVYLDNGIATKAIARWGGTIGENGEVIPSPSASPFGIVTEVIGATVTVLMKGKCTDSAVINALAAQINGTGPHYLSMEDEGKVTSIRPYMAVRVFTPVDSNTILVDIEAPPKEQHAHKTYTLSSASGDWSYDAEEDHYTYTGEGAEEFALMPVVNPVVAVDGVINTDYAAIYDDGLARIKVSTLPEDPSTITLYLTIPYTTDLPVVRAIEAKGSPRLKVRGTNGLVTLSLDEEVPEATTPINASTAIHNYSAGVPITTKVVSELVAGANVTVTPDPALNGKYVISSGYAENTPVYPSFIDLNGVSAIGNGSEIYYYFPATAGKSITGVIPVLPPPSGVRYDAHPFVIASGKAATFSGATFSYGVTHYPTPSEGESLIPDAVTGSITGVGVSASHIAMFTSATAVSITAGGQVFLTIAKTTSSAAYISGFGLIIVPKDVTP